MFSAVAGNSGVTKRDTSSQESHHHCLKIPTYKVVIRSSSRSSTQLLLFVSPYFCEVVMTRGTFSFIWCDWCDLFWGMGEIEGKDEVSIPRTFSWWQEPWSCHNSSIRRSGSSCEFLPRNAWRNTPSTPSVPKDDKCAEQFKQTNNQIKLAHQPRVQHLAKSKANPTSNHLKTDVRKIVTKHVWQDMVSPAAAVPPPVWSSRFFISRVYRVSFPAKSSNTLSNRKGCVCFFCKLSGISTTV